MLRWFARLVPLAIILLAIGLRIWDPPPLARFRNLAFDTYQRLQPRPADAERAPVVIVEVDDESLRRLGQWPWPRTRLATLVDRIRGAGAVAVGFDMVFAEPDRTSPKQIIELWPKTPELDALRAQANKLPDHDKQFAEALAKLPAILAFGLVDRRMARAPARNATYGDAGDRLPFFPSLSGALPNLALLEAAANGNGAINWPADADGIVRRVPILLRLGKRLYPSLFAEVLRVVQDERGYKLRPSGAAVGREPNEVDAVQIGRSAVPVDTDGLMSVYFSRYDKGRYVAAWKVLAGDAAALARFKGRVVLIGASAAGLFEFRATPLSPAVPGVEVHAQAIEQVMSGIHLSRPGYALGLEVGAILLLGLIVVLVVPRVRPLWAVLTGILALYVILIAAWYAFTGERLLIDGVYPALVILLVFVATAVLGYLWAEDEKRAVRRAFGRHMAPALVEELANRPERQVLSGERREMTVLFSDIRGFATLSERFDAREMTRFMNRYLTPMTNVILGRGGTLDNHVGGAVTAFWNAPLDDPDHADHAGRAALDMLDRLAGLNAALRAEASSRRDAPVAVDVGIGIGINTGVCCVGDMGPAHRFDYSVLGEEASLAARLAGQGTAYGVNILIGETTQAAAPHLAALEIDLIRVKGRNAPARLYALFGDETAAADPDFQKLAEAQAAFLEAYRAQRWGDAQELLAICRGHGGPWLRDLYDLFSARIRAFRQRSPGAAWDGVYAADAK